MCVRSQDVYQWLRLSPKDFESLEAYKKEKSGLRNELIADGADVLRVLPPMGYLPWLLKSNFAAQPAFSGWMGVIVGLIGTRKVWMKCK